jgi:hypothetical protein
LNKEVEEKLRLKWLVEMLEPFVPISPPVSNRHVGLSTQSRANCRPHRAEKKPRPQLKTKTERSENFEKLGVHSRIIIGLSLDNVAQLIIIRKKKGEVKR